MKYLITESQLVNIIKKIIKEEKKKPNPIMSLPSDKLLDFFKDMDNSEITFVKDNDDEDIDDNEDDVTYESYFKKNN